VSLLQLEPDRWQWGISSLHTPRRLSAGSEPAKSLRGQTNRQVLPGSDSGSQMASALPPTREDSEPLEPSVHQEPPTLRPAPPLPPESSNVVQYPPPSSPSDFGRRGFLVPSAQRARSGHSAGGGAGCGAQRARSGHSAGGGAGCGAQRARSGHSAGGGAGCGAQRVRSGHSAGGGALRLWVRSPNQRRGHLRSSHEPGLRSRGSVTRAPTDSPIGGGEEDKQPVPVQAGSRSVGLRTAH
jgi:hypothetical protein